MLESPSTQARKPGHAPAKPSVDLVVRRPGGACKRAHVRKTPHRHRDSPPEILRELAARHPERLEIHAAWHRCPSGAAYQSCPLRVRGPLFDQLAVPIKTIGKTLVNLSGPTSVLKRKQLSVVHDASVLAYPESFAPMFRWAYRVMYWAAVHFIEIPVTVSAFSRSEIVKHYGGRARRFAVVSCGSEHAERIRAVPPSVEVPEPTSSASGASRAGKSSPLLHEAARNGINVAVIGAAGPSSVFGGDGASSSVRDESIHYPADLPMPRRFSLSTARLPGFSL